MMWRGRELSELSDIIDRVSYVDGASETFSILRKRGIKIAVASAGLSLMVSRIARELGADFAVANELVLKNGRLTGDVTILVSLANKVHIIKGIAKNFNISMNECAVIGDYIYDIPQDAGLKVAFNPKDKEAERLADVVVRSSNIKDILNYLL